MAYKTITPEIRERMNAYKRAWRKRRKESGTKEKKYTVLKGMPKAQYLREYRKQNPTPYIKNKAYNLKTMYGITLDQYTILLQGQDHKCRACGVDFHKLPSSKFVHIDHCHETGKIRGVLCHWCNTALGSVKDNIDCLKKLIIYLEKFGE